MHQGGPCQYIYILIIYECIHTRTHTHTNTHMHICTHVRTLSLSQTKVLLTNLSCYLVFILASLSTCLSNACCELAYGWQKIPKPRCAKPPHRLSFHESLHDLDVERAVGHASEAYVYRALYTALSCEISYLPGTMVGRVLDASRVDASRVEASRGNAGRENERIGSRE